MDSVVGRHCLQSTLALINTWTGWVRKWAHKRIYFTLFSFIFYYIHCFFTIITSSSRNIHNLLVFLIFLKHNFSLLHIQWRLSSVSDVCSIHWVNFVFVLIIISQFRHKSFIYDNFYSLESIFYDFFFCLWFLQFLLNFHFMEVQWILV